MLLCKSGNGKEVERLEKDKQTYVLEMDNIAKEYSGNRVLKGVNLHIRPGEIPEYFNPVASYVKYFTVP